MPEGRVRAYEKRDGGETWAARVDGLRGVCGISQLKRRVEQPPRTPLRELSLQETHLRTIAFLPHEPSDSRSDRRPSAASPSRSLASASRRTRSSARPRWRNTVSSPYGSCAPRSSGEPERSWRRTASRTMELRARQSSCSWPTPIRVAHWCLCGAAIGGGDRARVLVARRWERWPLAVGRAGEHEGRRAAAASVLGRGPNHARQVVVRSDRSRAGWHRDLIGRGAGAAVRRSGRRWRARGSVCGFVLCPGCQCEVAAVTVMRVRAECLARAGCSWRDLAAPIAVHVRGE